MKKADMVLMNGRILSIKSDGSRISGQAVAVIDGIITKIGTNELIREYTGEETRIIDCQGNTILPGLCDAHCHPSISASTYSGCDLFGIYIQDDETADEAIDKYMCRLKKFVEEHPDNELIRGTGWVKGNFTGERVPTRHDIDRICSDRPVILESFCQHNLWVNTKAIELAGVDENTPDVYAGRIFREADGYPQGLFNDPEAMALIKDNVPGYDYSVEQYKESMMYYQENHANKYGVTMVMDCMHSDNAREAYKQLADEGRLTIRARGVYLAEPGKASEQLPEYIARKGQDDSGNDFRIDTVKMFSEGGFSLVEPYEKDFNEDIAAMSEADIIANCQPRWMVYDSDIAGMLPMVGRQRAESAYPLRRFLDAGITVAFGTDFPVTPPPDAMHEIQCAMTRSVFPDAPDYEGFKGKVLGDERPAELYEAVQALSINGAIQMLADEYTGSIEEGKSALCPACVLLYYGIINELTAGHFPLTLLIAGIAMTLTATSYAKMCRKYPMAGSVYSYVSKSIGPKIGFLAGWTMMVDYFLLPMACYLSCGLYLNVMFPVIPIWVWIVISVVFCAVCNYIGVGFAAIINNINVIVPIICVVLTVIWIIKFVISGGGSGTLLYGEALYNPETFVFGNIMTGAAIMAIVFVGFDSVTTYAEETIEPEKTMPRAVLIICVGAAVEFFILAYLMNCGWPFESGMLENPDTAITEYYVHIGMSWMNTIFVGINTLACIGCCIAGQGDTARILLGMGRDGFIPKKFFGYVHPKFKTPSRNVLLSAAIGMTALVFQDSLTNAMSLVSFGAITGFILTNICVIFKYWIKDKERSAGAFINYIVVPTVAAIICIYLWFSLTGMAKIVGFSWLALGVVFLAIKTKGFRELPPELNL